jgi:hypothetical protein
VEPSLYVGDHLKGQMCRTAECSHTRIKMTRSAPRVRAYAGACTASVEDTPGRARTFKASTCVQPADAVTVGRSRP